MAVTKAEQAKADKAEKAEAAKAAKAEAAEAAETEAAEEAEFVESTTDAAQNRLVDSAEYGEAIRQETIAGNHQRRTEAHKAMNSNGQDLRP